ncbi:MAG: putative Ig domain-containing protein [Phycisphaerae bacterium]|nr:putative Ig domain-containing protein [Phycisphaerae bacterium]
MKRCGLALLLVLFTAAAGQAFDTAATRLNASGYYTWGVDPESVSIPDGYIITEAVVTLYGLTSISDSPLNTLVIYLLDNPPVGWHENTDIPGVDHFAPHGCRLKPDYVDRIQGHETAVFRLAAIDDPDSWVWKIYDRPFVFEFPDAQPVKFSSALLELIDYVGNATPFGIGLDPAGAGDFTLRGLSLTLTIQAFQGPANASQLRLTFGDTNSVPVPAAPALRVISEGALGKFTFTAVDPDGDDVHLVCNTLPVGATFENGVFSWTPPFNIAKRGSAVPFALTVTASDHALSTSRTFVFWVWNTNRPPFLRELTLVPTENKTHLAYRVSAVDPDGDPLTCYADSLPVGATFDPITWRLDWNTSSVAPGVYAATFTVSDGSLKHTQTFSIEVENRSGLTDRLLTPR